MLRLLSIILLSAFSSMVFAAEGPPTLFEPASEDVSLYYLGEMFGNGLIPGGADTFLLSYVFEIFNQVCLITGLMVIIYSLMVGVLQTSGQGKVLGEKWSATFLPIRTVIGIGLLIPKAGSGYCLAQSLVMWMVIQGIGGADALWSRALDYFIEGGGVLANETSSGTQPYSASYMNTTTLDSTYSIERQTLINATCLAAHNETEAAKFNGKYQVYRTENHKYVNFGHAESYNPEADPNSFAGRECGYMITPAFIGDYTQEQIDLMEQTYNNAFYDLGRGLSDIAKFLISEEGNGGEDGKLWADLFHPTQSRAVAFIEYLHGADSILYPHAQTHEGEGKYRDQLEQLKKYGWILAGNYYMTLTRFDDALLGIELVINDFDTVKLPSQEAQDLYPDEIKNARDYWEIDNSSDPRQNATFSTWEELYVLPGYGDITKNPAQAANLNEFTYEDLENIKDNLRQIGNMRYTGNNSTMDPLFYLKKLTGFGERVSDPILHAAEYGGYLTEVAVNMMWITILAYIVMAVIAAQFMGPCLLLPSVLYVVLLFILFTAPLIFGIAAFLYVQGAMLSVALPLIPFVIFLVAALGWFAAVIESIVAAPLIAIGLVFPEANQDIWGKAEPAYMMILNLFMRPSLIIVGFVAGMILTWIAIELLNSAFYLFIIDASFIENYFFGYIVTTMAYVSLLISVVTKTFSLITDLPNRTLAWIGDRTQGQPGAESMLGGMKGGVERATGAVGGAVAMGGSTTEKAATATMDYAKTLGKTPPKTEEQLTSEHMDKEAGAKGKDSKGRSKSFEMKDMSKKKGEEGDD